MTAKLTNKIALVRVFLKYVRAHAQLRCPKGILFVSSRLFFRIFFFFVKHFCFYLSILLSWWYFHFSALFVAICDVCFPKKYALLLFSTWLPQNCLKTLEWLFYVVFVDYLRNSSNIIETFSLKLLTPTRNLIWFLRFYANLLAIRRIWWCKSILFQYEV